MHVAELMPRHPSESARSAAGCSTRVSNFDSRSGSPFRFGNTRSSGAVRVDPLAMRLPASDRVRP